MPEPLAHGFSYQAGVPTSPGKSSTWIIFSADHPIGILPQDVLDQLADEVKNIKAIILSTQRDELYVRLHNTDIGLATMDLLARKLNRYCVPIRERVSRQVRERRIRRYIGPTP